MFLFLNDMRNVNTMSSLLDDAVLRNKYTYIR